jgi:hypothetical protein
MVQASAIISDCGRYRYRLTRQWSDQPALPFVRLNPSTADAEVNDPTIRRCMNFAMRDYFGGIVVVNIFAFRATDPADLLNAQDPHGPENDDALWRVAHEAVIDNVPIVCAWGAHGMHDADTRVIQILKREGARLRCFELTKHGHPRHPLYIKSNKQLIPFAH